MIVCVCQPFSDRDVAEMLPRLSCHRVSTVYRACTGGKTPCCARCVPTLKEIVAEHSAAFCSTSSSGVAFHENHIS